jgi:hypothetical protein
MPKTISTLEKGVIGWTPALNWPTDEAPLVLRTV